MDRTKRIHSSSDLDALPVSQRIVREVAAATDTDPTDLDPLYDQVDPDSLDALFRARPPSIGRTGGRVTFPMAGCEVVVRADGSIDVEPDGETPHAPSPGNAHDRSTGATESSD